MLFVVDGSDPTYEAQLEVSRSVLREIGADEVPSRLVLNKMDRVDAAGRAALMEKHTDAILLSAHAPDDVSALRDTIIGFFEAAMVEDVLVPPYARQDLVGEIYESARVLSEDQDETGPVLRVRGPAQSSACGAALPHKGPPRPDFGDTRGRVWPESARPIIGAESAEADVGVG